MTRALALAGLAGLGTRAALAQTPKATQAAAHYQDQPKDGKKCATCSFFIPPTGATGGGMMGGRMGPGMMGSGMGPGMMAGTCKIVQGSINPNGWCDFYSPRPA